MYVILFMSIFINKENTLNCGVKNKFCGGNIATLNIKKKIK